MTITVHEKGRTIEDRGGLIVASDMWLGPEIPAMRELAEFQLRYWKAIAPEAPGMSPEQLATVVAMYPLVKQAMDRLNREQVNMKGTPLLTVTTFDAVKSADQTAKESQSSSGGGLSGGMSGMLARKMMKKDKDEKPRVTIFTINEKPRDRHVGQRGRPRDSRRVQAEQVEPRGWRNAAPVRRCAWRKRRQVNRELRSADVVQVDAASTLLHDA